MNEDFINIFDNILKNKLEISHVAGLFLAINEICL